MNFKLITRVLLELILEFQENFGISILNSIYTKSFIFTLRYRRELYFRCNNLISFRYILNKFVCMITSLLSSDEILSKFVIIMYFVYLRKNMLRVFSFIRYVIARFKNSSPKQASNLLRLLKYHMLNCK